MDSSPGKDIVLGGHPFKFHGRSVDDDYFAPITSNFESEFCSLCSRLVLPDYFCIDVGTKSALSLSSYRAIVREAKS
jgi:hypothetical protein